MALAGCQVEGVKWMVYCPGPFVRFRWVHHDSQRGVAQRAGPTMRRAAIARTARTMTRDLLRPFALGRQLQQ